MVVIISDLLFSIDLVQSRSHFYLRCKAKKQARSIIEVSFLKNYTFKQFKEAVSKTSDTF